MSKDEFYEEPFEKPVVQSVQPLDEPVKKRKWSFWGYGLLFFTVFYIALMFILEASIQPRENMTATIVAYIIGILGLAIFAGLVRDKSRVLISIPILLIIVFGTGYLFNYVAQAPVYNPLAPVSERTGTLLETFDALNDTEVMDALPADFPIEQVEFYSQFAFVIDLIIALPLFIFGTLSLTWFTQIFTQLPKIWTIFSVLFALIFFLIGLVLTPFVHLLFSSFLVLGSDLLPGALYVMEGISIFQGDFASMTQEEINAAIEAFYNASFYFNQAAMNLEGLQKAGIIGLAQLIPILGTVVSNLYWFSLAALHLSSGLGPFANGTFSIMIGLQDAMDAMNMSEPTPMPLTVKGTETVKTTTVINETLFESALEVVNDGLLTLGESTEYIEQALEDLENVSIEDIIANITQIPGVPAEAVEPIMETMVMVEDYLGMFEGGVTVISALVDKPEISPGVESEYATLTHFLYGAYNLFKAGDNIAEITAFNGTSENFEYSYGNFSIVQEQLHKPAIMDVATSDIPILNETVLFVVDMVDIGVPLCDLGYTLATSFLDMDSILNVFDGQDYEDVSDYPSLISSLDDLRTTTSSLAISATAVDDNITSVANKASNETYGILNDIALTFSTQLSEFGFSQYVLNANYVANSFYYMFAGIMELSFVFGNITAGQAYIAAVDYASANTSFNDAKTSLTASVGYLNQSIPYMDDAVNIGGMTQLQATLDSITTIRNTLLGIQTDLDTLIVLMADPVTNAAAIDTLLTSMLDDLADVNTDLDDVTAQ